MPRHSNRCQPLNSSRCAIMTPGEQPSLATSMVPVHSTLVVIGWHSAEYYQMDAWRESWASKGGGVLVN